MKISFFNWEYPFTFGSTTKNKLMKSKMTALIAALLLTGSAFAQKIILESGKVPSLLSEKKINVEYDYSSFGVGKYKTEAEYVKHKMEEAEKKEAGKGKKWQDGWVDARKERYEPKFEELINKATSKGASFGSYPDAKYTLKVKTTFVEPGWNVGVSKKPAFVSFEYYIMETASPEKVIAKLSQQKVPGSQAMGYDFDMGSRLAESYSKAGKMLGKYLSK
jgi:hypothetical protein